MSEDTFQILNPMPNVKIKHSLIKTVGECLITKRIVDYVRENFSDFENLKFDLEFLEHILQIVKNIIPKKREKKADIDKFNIIEKIYLELFAFITPEELITIKSNVEYLITNKIIKRIPLTKKFLKLVSSFVLNYAII